MNEEIWVRVLGPLEVTVAGVALTLGGVKPRSVLALLAIEPGRVVASSSIVDRLWGDAATMRSASTLHVHVSNLRKALEPAARALGVPDLVATVPPGYRLDPGGARLDLTAFESALDAARRARRSRELPIAVRHYRAALDLWRGEPIADLGAEEFAGPVAARLTAMRAGAIEERYDVELAMGRHSEVLGELGSLVAADPLNETLRGLWMVALYRSGRQAAALAAYTDGRRVLVDELGIEPGPALRELEARILAHDADLGLERSGEASMAMSTILGTAPADTPRAWLVGGDERTELTRAITTIGRNSDRDIVVDDPKVSRAHAEVRRRAGGFRLVDCGSTNGTFVCEALVSEAELATGDEIRIGSRVWRFELV